MHATPDTLCDQLRQLLPSSLCGSVVRTSGMTAAVADFPAPVGAIVEIERQTGGPLAGEVIGFHDDLTLVYLLDNVQGLRRGNRVRLCAVAGPDKNYLQQEAAQNALNVLQDRWGICERTSDPYKSRPKV